MAVDLNHGSGFQYVPQGRPRSTEPPVLKFNESDAHRAHDDWGANCGPGAVAAIMGMSLDEVRPHMGDFETKRYTNPTLMGQVLRSIRRSWRLSTARPLTWPDYGLARVQWEGPWTEPGVPIVARYRKTHWVASCAHPAWQWAIFDINCIAHGWLPYGIWQSSVVPWLLRECVPKANGRWHLTHVIQVAPHEHHPV